MTLVELEYPKIERIEGDERYAKFACEPLPPGYGTTLGNSLRRVLLSSLPGAAITAARVRGVAHEFSTIPGVKEDVVQLVLNLKQIPFKILSEGFKIARLRLERMLLKPMRKLADVVIDTTRMNVHELRDFVQLRFGGIKERATVFISVISFGFRFGAPADAELVFDVRFLPNPNYIPRLKNKTGRDVGVQLLQPIKQLRAEHVRETDVEDSGMEEPLAQLLQCFLARGGCLDLVAHLQQNVGQGLTIARCVVHDQDPGLAVAGK